ncbi:MAG TPA: hypothetical protein VGF71_06340 [Caulobacteraceae bacterium]
MKRIPKIATGALFGLAAAAIMAPAASAAIVCNADGDCWHVHKHYNYAPDFGVTVHPDNWTWGTDDHYRWREHNGRGYWKSGVWITF